MKMPDILILYVEIMPYNLSVWRILRDKGYKLKIIELSDKKLTPFRYQGEDGIEVCGIHAYQDYSTFLKDNYHENLKLLFVSEVFNIWYWRLAHFYHRKNGKLPIILGSDAQWTGNLHNYLKKVFFRVTYRQVFTHVLCAGLWQVVYALKIGFKREQILTPLYCANNDEYYRVDISEKIGKYPKRFLFVGRLTEVKGIYEIVGAWQRIRNKRGWRLTMIGNGHLDSYLSQQNDLEVLPFMSQNEICKIMQDSGCALIPSLYEPWGLVIHEAAAAGLPIIVSRNCGATNQFVQHGYNGLLVKEGDTETLRYSMEMIMDSSDEELIAMSMRSRELSKSIIPECVASAYLSLINSNPLPLAKNTK